MIIDFNKGESVTLKDGTVITATAYGEFPPLQEVGDYDRACNVCPIHELCQDNNNFDCMVYGMFSGGCATLKDSLDMCQKYEKLKGNKK